MVGHDVISLVPPHLGLMSLTYETLGKAGLFAVVYEAVQAMDVAITVPLQTTVPIVQKLLGISMR